MTEITLNSLLFNFLDNNRQCAINITHFEDGSTVTIIRGNKIRRFHAPSILKLVDNLKVYLKIKS